MTLESEVELLLRAKAGDPEAFGELAVIYESYVYTVAYRYLGQADDAAEAAQEAFLRAYRGLKDFRADCSFKTWLDRIIVNICRDELRRRSRRPEIVSAQVGREHDPGLARGNDIYLDLTSRSDPGVLDNSQPEDAFLKQEEEEYLQHLLGRLPREYRLTLVMREFQGLGYGEIAERLGCSLGTVKSRLNRARQLLRKEIMEDREHFAPSLRLVRQRGDES